MSSRQETIQRVGAEKLVPIVRGDKTLRLLDLSDRLAECGLHVLEMTFTTPGALDELQKLRAERPGITVGMGSVRSAEMAKDAADAGADFVVSPIHSRAIVDVAHDAGIAAISGAFTPTEAEIAHLDGSDLIKIFPASTLGPGFISSLLAPLPHLRLVPTGGVTGANAGSFIQAGAFAVCLGSWLIDRESLRTGDYTRVFDRAQTLLKCILDNEEGDRGHE